MDRVTQEPYTPQYEVDEEPWHGIILRRLADGAEVYLQGDDATQILTELEQLDKLWCYRETHPKTTRSPFRCFEEHQDAMLSQYDEVMQVPDLDTGDLSLHA